ncbi:hypothetical protein KsCSTR_17030 [Candidatus Kuenenia stuttgartiensis]|uniref:Uncharacterized protein n=1 Tax=Kuenenia stuttgartiensis TaxID=174633 RepID=Q1Q216_KUEST|nr:hypothetical protein KsCSTR_17030 [Candidatus Kuenenia stuttgartiensis]CAJ74051.1 unknown protein [Candidatus Kuenenia stuttgartiensis]
MGQTQGLVSLLNSFIIIIMLLDKIQQSFFLTLKRKMYLFDMSLPQRKTRYPYLSHFYL